ncbi:hypothetical protein GVN21_09245 [Caulobacter sp. SLTY]|uniref:hypothetical protein n=1 Tax=Caulobacter sp. SLTY TaxID=2683262 RepID=UPI001412B2A9|nr:hypothetical protein [Caulobacter sp. SLTY]NBB15538.1 hypothetical protein [Caulobacter sp. SLTY]
MTRLFRPLLIAAGLAALASPAAAVTVRACDGITDQAMNIIEPWERNSWAYYGGRVRVAVLDTGGEPACCSSHLLVMFPDDQSPGGGLVCRLISDRGANGFAGIDPRSVKSAYDPKRGLQVSFSYSYFPRGGEATRRGVAKVRVNLARNTVTVE